jgi:peptidylprolyl isomerase
MRCRPFLLMATLVVAALTLVGCRSGTPGAAHATPSGALPTVLGGFGENPAITFPRSGPPAAVSADVLVTGTGRVVTGRDVIVVNYVGQVWGGAVFANTYESGRPLVRALTALVAGWSEHLVGSAVGSRMLLSLPPSAAYGKDGAFVPGIGPTDTAVYVVDVMDVFGADAAGQAGAVPDPAAAASVAPQVHGELGTPAGLALPAGVAAPTHVVTTVLARGTGAPVRAGDLVGQYAGVDWMGNTVGSSWQAGTPEVFPVSADVPTFAGLIGVPVGSRVLLQEPATTASPAVAVVVDLIAQP